jgi:hypothetical protein
VDGGVFDSNLKVPRENTDTFRGGQRSATPIFRNRGLSHFRPKKHTNLCLVGCWLFLTKNYKIVGIVWWLFVSLFVEKVATYLPVFRWVVFRNLVSCLFLVRSDTFAVMAEADPTTAEVTAGVTAMATSTSEEETLMMGVAPDKIGLVIGA